MATLRPEPHSPASEDSPGRDLVRSGRHPIRHVSHGEGSARRQCERRDADEAHCREITQCRRQGQRGQTRDETQAGVPGSARHWRTHHTSEAIAPTGQQTEDPPTHDDFGVQHSEPLGEPGLRTPSAQRGSAPLLRIRTAQEDSHHCAEPDGHGQAQPARGVQARSLPTTPPNTRNGHDGAQAEPREVKPHAPSRDTGSEDGSPKWPRPARGTVDPGPARRPPLRGRTPTPGLERSPEAQERAVQPAIGTRAASVVRGRAPKRRASSSIDPSKARMETRPTTKMPTKPAVSRAQHGVPCRGRPHDISGDGAQLHWSACLNGAPAIHSIPARACQYGSRSWMVPALTRASYPNDR